MINVIFLIIGVCLVLTTGAELFAQDHENIEQIGQLYNFWQTANDVAIQGDYAYVAAAVAGLQVLDISDPSDPNIVSHSGRNLYAVCLNGNYLYGIDNYGLIIVDISDPLQTEVVGSISTEGDARDVQVFGNYAIIADGARFIGNRPYGSTLVVIDISDPVNPEEVSVRRTPGDPQHVAVTEDYTFVVDRDGLQIYDLSNPANPEHIGSFETAGRAQDLAVDGNLVYVADYQNCLLVIDISDPTSPQETSSYETGGDVYRIIVSDDYAYICDSNSSLRILNITDPQNLEELSTWNEAEVRTWALFKDEGFIYLATGTSGLRVVDVSDPANPEGIGALDPPSGELLGVDVSDGYAYVTDNENGLRVIDVSDPTEPVETAICESLENAGDIQVSQGAAYVIDLEGGLYSVDISDPNQPLLADYIETVHAAYELCVVDNIAYIAAAAFHIIDISDPGNLTELNYCELPSLAISVAVSGDFAIIGYEWGRGLCIMDISDPENMVWVGNYEGSGLGQDIGSMGDYLYVVGRGGFSVIDFSDPHNPDEIGFCRTRGFDLEVCGSHVFVASESNGLHVLDVTDPEYPHEVGYFDTPGIAMGLSVVDDIVYVAGHTNFGVYNCSEAMSISRPDMSAVYSYGLLPAYPNPFNSTTMICYKLPLSSNISVELIDLSGNLLEILVSGNFKPGIHTTSITSNNLPSGLYFVRLAASDHVFTKKIMLIR